MKQQHIFGHNYRQRYFTPYAALLCTATFILFAMNRVAAQYADWKHSSSMYILTTPEGAKSCWKTPGPAAGPFKRKLGDGSTVTYYWYRFADQPALLNADMTNEEREKMQRRVELLHRNWTKDREYLPPPLIGKLAEIDPALIVTPPKGMEIGNVPIVTRQGLDK